MFFLRRSAPRTFIQFFEISRPDKKHRKKLLNDFKRKEMAAAFAALPIANVDFQALFDMLDVSLPLNRCDHSRRLTVAHIRKHSLPEEAVLHWLNENGGFCDCEVLANSLEAWKACKNYQDDS